MKSPDEWRHHREPDLGTDDEAAQPDQPESPDLALDELLFGAVSTNGLHPPGAGEPGAQPTLFDPPDHAAVVDADELADDDALLDEDRFVDEDQFGEPDELAEPDELLREDELGDDTVVAEPADVMDEEEEMAPAVGRGRRRAWVLAGTVTVIVVIGAAAGVALVGGAADSAPSKTRVPERTAPRTTMTPPVPTTTPPPPAPATIAPATTVTTRRTMPVPGGVPVQPAPPPPAPPPPAPTPPPTSPQTTAPPSTTSSP